VQCCSSRFRLQRISEIHARRKPDQIYNVDESRLCWKGLPAKAFTFIESVCLRHRSSKEHLMVMCCANASGNHKTELVVIGKGKTHICLKTMKQRAFLSIIIVRKEYVWIETFLKISFIHVCSTDLIFPERKCCCRKQCWCYAMHILIPVFHAYYSLYYNQLQYLFQLFFRPGPVSLLP
jgi:hypothetical protein